MANRCTLSINKLPQFKEWLIENGWHICPTKGHYEVLRAVHIEYKYPLIIFKRLDAKEHLSVYDRDMGIVWRFISWTKGDINGTLD